MSSATTVIVGGGVIGLSTAYQLARRDAGRIILIEKGQLGSGASSRAAGIGTHLLWSETGVRARQLGFQLFREFSTEWDDYTFHDEHGCLNLVSPSEWEATAELFEMYDQLGIPYQILDAKEIHYRWPTLCPPENYSGLYDLYGGYSEPDEYIAALLKRIRQLGVQVFEDEPVVDFLQDRNRLSGVMTSARTIEADNIISTVHIWSLPLLSKLELRFPMKAFVHQRYVSKPLPIPWLAPPVNANSYLGYLRPAFGNRILMGVETPDREEHLPTADFEMNELSTRLDIRDQAKSHLSQLAPVLKDVSWESESVGLLSFSCDGEPILGPVRQMPGLFVATSFHSGGFSYNAVAGQLMAELVTEGVTSIDISAFTPDRFDPDKAIDYLATKVPQFNAVRRRH
ncbi:NAD(P)/FAD-dependent oxidoreductase [Bythopirellula goksoeyrii]|uniref:4-methylaminobutanoate oxidase (Formaldehyde-forming) n=1 Tax=Bythopirellula goksoeyrii TaxID=1400387 RepID=A0A5B9Q2Z7_9BACT|nr:FAD-binding oxidoreductase [Bythopirellula goksoeyrii]QEG33408.1 4-methylaminobutanoate oxidase (formaldehyde-forming) [Bythopirellula goksoeyrii]